MLVAMMESLFRYSIFMPLTGWMELLQDLVLLKRWLNQHRDEGIDNWLRNKHKTWVQLFIHALTFLNLR